MNEIRLTRPYVTEARTTPDNPALRWVVVAQFVGGIGVHETPFSSRGGAIVVASYIREHGIMPSPYGVESANRVMAYELAASGKQDAWVPASGGLEAPTVARNGRRVLYCFNHATQEHGYIDMDKDMLVMADELADYGLV